MVGDGRFRAELFRYDRAGRHGDARAVPWSSSAGAFWFYDYGNPEAAIKMVDGGAVNGRHWLFYGPLSDAYVALTVTDLERGDSRRWPEPGPPLGVLADLAAFPAGGPPPAGAGPVPMPSTAACSAPGVCLPADTRLCLHGGRFAVELTWTDPTGADHAARAFAHSDRAGYLAFYGTRDLQTALKILDGRPVNGRFWLFATSLTHLGYTLKVTDTSTGTVYEYPKPAGGFASVFDLGLGGGG